MLDRYTSNCGGAWSCPTEIPGTVEEPGLTLLVHLELWRSLVLLHWYTWNCGGAWSCSTGTPGTVGEPGPANGAPGTVGEPGPATGAPGTVEEPGPAPLVHLELWRSLVLLHWYT